MAILTHHARGRVPSLHFPRLRSGDLRGIFWLMPESWQRQRIRDLARTLTPETISTICRRSYRETVAIIEARQ